MNAKNWDVFISHASEDKDFVHPLANRLKAMGLLVWLDQFELTLGDSLRRSIDQGLANSKFGVVVISPSFLRKEWPQRELDGLVAREIAGSKVILPVLHNISIDEVRRYSPPLADKLAVSSDRGLASVTDAIIAAVEKSKSDLIKALERVDRHRVSASPSAASTLYCSECGAVPGAPSSCPGRTSHIFVKASGLYTFCTECGGLPGSPSTCPSRSSHIFMSAVSKNHYCSECGGVPGQISICPGRTSHRFIIAD